jgi:hypothetical protein
MFHVVFILLALVGVGGSDRPPSTFIPQPEQRNSCRQNISALPIVRLGWHRAADQPHGLERGTNRGRLWRSAIHRARITRIERLRRCYGPATFRHREEKKNSDYRVVGVFFASGCSSMLSDFCSPDSRRRYEGCDRFDGSL